MTGLAMAVGMAVGTFVALVAMSRGFKRSIPEPHQNRGVDLIVSCAGGKELSTTMPEEVAKDIAELPDVAATAPGLIDIVSFENMGIYNKLLQGWPLESFMYQELKPIDGERLSEKWRGKKGIMLGNFLAKTIGKKAGDKITIFGTEEYQIVGVYETFSPIENDGMVMLLEDLQKLSSKPGLISGCTIRLKAGANPDDFQRKAVEIKHKIENEIALKYHIKGKVQATLCRRPD